MKCLVLKYVDTKCQTMSGLKGSVSYSYSFKMKVLEEVLSGRESKVSASRRYGIKGHSTIAKWLRKLDESNLHFTVKESSNKKDNESRIRDLEAALAFEKLKSRAYEEMIKIAESELNISIEKKFDTKQSKK